MTEVLRCHCFTIKVQLLPQCFDSRFIRLFTAWLQKIPLPLCFTTQVACKLQQFFVFFPLIPSTSLFECRKPIFPQLVSFIISEWFYRRGLPLLIWLLGPLSTGRTSSIIDVLAPLETVEVLLLALFRRLPSNASTRALSSTNSVSLAVISSLCFSIWSHLSFQNLLDFISTSLPRSALNHSTSSVCEVVFNCSIASWASANSASSA